MLAGFVILWLAILVWLSFVLPRISSESHTLYFVLSIAAAILIAVLAIVSLFRSRTLDSSSNLKLHSWWPALVSPVIGTLLFVFIGSAPSAPYLLMNEDMVWNTAQSMFIQEAGGVDSLHPNPAPLSNLIFALSYGVSSQVSLGTALSSHFVVVAVIAFLTSFISGLCAVVRLKNVGSAWRILLILAVGWLPYTFVILGAVVYFGHVNALVSYLLLWCIWIVFEREENPVLLRLALLLLSCTVILASWAPLVVVPVTLGAITVWQGVRQWRRVHVKKQLSVWELAAFLLAGAQLLVYGILVTLPDLRRDGQALGKGGGVLDISVFEAVGIFVLLGASLVWLLLWKKRIGHSRQDAIGLAGLLLASAAATGYLMVQRLSTGLDLWGYYPNKFVAILLPMLVAVTAIAIGEIALSTTENRTKMIGLGVIGLLFISIVVAPSSWRGIATYAPLIKYVRDFPDNATSEMKIGDLVRVLDYHDGSAALFVFWGTEAQDGYFNRYLIQLSAEKSTEPVREFAYLAPLLTTEDFLCRTIDTWNEPVTIYSRPSAVAKVEAILDSCGPLPDVTIRTELPE